MCWYIRLFIIWYCVKITPDDKRTRDMNWIHYCYYCISLVNWTMFEHIGFVALAIIETGEILTHLHFIVQKINQHQTSGNIIKLNFHKNWYLLSREFSEMVNSFQNLFYSAISRLLPGFESLCVFFDSAIDTGDCIILRIVLNFHRMKYNSFYSNTISFFNFFFLLEYE